MRAHLPNLLTFSRVAAVPLALVLMLAHLPGFWLFWLFTLASITDFLDGYLARRWKAESAIGALLDPVADKLLVALLLLYWLQADGEVFVPVVVILARELYISGLREFLAAQGKKLPVSNMGKLKTTLQMLAVTAFLAMQAFDVSALYWLAHGGLWAAAAVSFFSAMGYSRAALRQWGAA